MLICVYKRGERERVCVSEREWERERKSEWEWERERETYDIDSDVRYLYSSGKKNNIPTWNTIFNACSTEETFFQDLQENLEDMFPRYYMHSDALYVLLSASFLEQSFDHQIFLTSWIIATDIWCINSLIPY